MQGYYLVKNYNKEELEFDRAVKFALRSTAQKINVKLPQKGLVKREASNVYQVNVQTKIEDPSILSVNLETELDRQGIDIPFEYGIYDCSTNELVYTECCSSSENKKSVKPRKGKGKKSESDYYFVVRFPDIENYVYEEMSTVIISSAVLFIACIIFASAIFMILRQKRYSELMRDFVNNMTHEFKTPISSIKIAADVLLHHPIIEEDKRLTQYTHIIRDQNQRLNDQVEKVLQIAKTESTSFELKKESIHIHEIIEQLTKQYRIRLSDQGGSIAINLNAQKDKIDGDRFHLTNVISNLLDNAIKYSKDKAEIIVRTEDSPDGLQLEIEDHGIGIKPEDLPNLFEKFYRVHTGDIHNVKGFGIGLYYVKRICDAHHFPVEIQSVYNKGTKVRILLKKSK